MATALVTGGSSGIGFAFAQQLAARGDDLILVARDQDRLESAANSLRNRYRVQVDTVSADLADLDDTRQIEQLIETQVIDTLVNDAGFAAHDDLLDTDWSGHAKAFDVMIQAVLVLSGAAARQMTARGHGAIINISSINSLLDADNYSAIKRWVISYTEALNGHLAGSGVHATVVMPGWVKTNFHSSAGLSRPHVPAFMWVKADQVAREGIAAAERGKILCVPTVFWKLAAWVLRHGPVALPRYIARSVRAGHRKAH